MEIKKKIWPRHFKEIEEGRKKFEVRLADFEVKEGDILVLEEFDPLTKKYTGRAIRKKINFVTKFNPMEFNDAELIKKHGLYGIGIE